MLFAILTTDINDTEAWQSSLKNSGIKYDVIDISVHNWMEYCLQKEYDVYLLRAPGLTDLQKQMFDEKAIILHKYLHKFVYPSLQEILIYENKKYLSYWLKSKSIPAPQTSVFYKKQDAEEYLKNAEFPLVAKMNIGASGRGVTIIKQAGDARKYCKSAFSSGIRPYLGPNLRTASLLTKLRNAYRKKGLIQKKISSIREVYKEPQKYVIFQEYIPHTYEWRVVVIGDSYFAHKKLVTGVKASGSLQKDYSNPPLSLLDFAKDICHKNELNSVSLDIFETPNGFLVNEIQTYFGQSDAFQMKVDDVIGRYLHQNGNWVFEAGDFASNQCYDLRVKHVQMLLDNKREAVK